MPEPSSDTISFFADLVTRADESIHLPAAALAIARIDSPTLDIRHHLEALARMGEQAHERLEVRRQREGGLVDPVAVLNEVVFDELGFEANRDDYYDPRNSFLNEVLIRRRGIPITLAVVYMEIASSAGEPMEGIGFPGHFLVRHVPSRRVLDVFNRGRVLELSDCRAVLRRQGLASQDWNDSFLDRVTRAQMLRRMLNNLRRHYADIEAPRPLALLDGMVRVLESARQDGAAYMVQ